MEGHYAAVYDASLNPFTDWRKKERQARRKRLTVTDRLMYHAGVLVYGSPCAPVGGCWCPARQWRPDAKAARDLLLGVAPAQGGAQA